MSNFTDLHTRLRRRLNPGFDRQSSSPRCDREKLLTAYIVSYYFHVNEPFYTHFDKCLCRWACKNLWMEFLVSIAKLKCWFQRASIMIRINWSLLYKSENLIKFLRFVYLSYIILGNITLTINDSHFQVENFSLKAPNLNKKLLLFIVESFVACKITSV